MNQMGADAWGTFFPMRAALRVEERVRLENNSLLHAVVVEFSHMARRKTTGYLFLDISRYI